MSKRSRALGTYGSFKPRSKLRSQLGKIIKTLLFLFLVYQIISVFIISSFVVDTSAMEPGIIKGQRLLAAPIVTGTSLTLPRLRIPGLKDPERGDLILVKPGNAEAIAWYIVLFDPIVRFFTLQEKTIIPGKNQNWNNQIAVKRIIALPGDTVKMIDFKFFVKPENKTGFMSEYSAASEEYPLKIPKGVPEMDPSIPFSGNMDEVKISRDHYFIANDNREVFYDSRFYGPVSKDNISGDVFLSYWPGFSFK